MLRLGILGASGFIGSRCIETFHLGQTFEVIPIIRNYGGLARLARFDLDCRIADGDDVNALQTAFRQCDVVVNCIVGNPDVIERTAESSYRAANAAGVKRLVYLSSMAVHGQAPPAGTDETTPLSIAQPLPYNRAKVRAERRLNRLREHGSTELTILRPGIVYGARSRWITVLAKELSLGTAYLVDGGQGIFNGIYVDNLVEAIRLCADSPHADRQPFLVSDQEQVTWADFYRPFADAFGLTLADITSLPGSALSLTWRDLAEQLRASQTVQRIMPLFPAQLKRAVKAAYARPHTPPVQQLREAPRPTPTAEMFLLQQSRYKAPSVRAQSTLGYHPSISFEEGCRRCLEWLVFCGFTAATTLVDSRVQ